MAQTGPRPVMVTLDNDDRQRVEALVVGEATSDRMRVRARIVLAAAEGRSNTEIAEAVGVTTTTVASWRRRWIDGGFAGLRHRSPTAGPGKRLGRPLEPLVVDDESRVVLERWTRRSTVSAGLARRARIVLAGADGASNAEVAQIVGCHVATVAKWRSRYVESGLVGLADEYRSGRPRTISDEDVEDVIVRTLNQTPPDAATQWSTRTMAEAAGLSQSSISRMWREGAEN